MVEGVSGLCHYMVGTGNKRLCSARIICAVVQIQFGLGKKKITVSKIVDLVKVVQAV